MSELPEILIGNLTNLEKMSEFADNNQASNREFFDKKAIDKYFKRGLLTKEKGLFLKYSS